MRILAGGSVFAGLRIDGVAGQGGMGVVYRATEPGLDRTVALKVIAPDLLEDAAARRRFVWEARAAAAIEHPNVVPIYAAGEEDGAAYIVMRMITGGDLRGLVRREGGLAPARAAAVVAQLGAALDAAHAAGIVHRDIKPANVLLDADEHVYLTDFGLARHLVSQSAVTRTGQWVGTLDYIAPEQIRGERVDARSDVYSLGCLLFYALTGHVPYRRESDEARLWAHLHAAPPRPSEHAPGLGRSFDAVVARAMAKRRLDRFPSAGELGRAALAAVEAGGAAMGRRGPARRRIAAAAGAAALVAAAGGVLIARGDDDPRPNPPRAAPSATARGVAREQPASRVTASVGVAARPVAIEVAGGNAWVASTRRPRLGRIDAGSAKRLRGPVVGRGPSDLAARGGVLWVAVADARRVLRLDARTGRSLERPLRLPGRPRIVDSGAGAIWVAEQTAELGGPYALARIDPRSARVTARVTIPEGINDVRAGHGAVWVLGRQEATLVKLAPRDLRVLSRRPVGPKSLQLDLSARHLWVTSYDDDSVARIDRVTGKTVTIGVPSKPYGIAVARDSVWVACFGAHSLVRIDRATSRVTGPELPVGLNPVGLDVSGQSLWVTARGDDRVVRVGL